jgi:hypothetical protein
MILLHRDLQRSLKHSNNWEITLDTSSASSFPGGDYRYLPKRKKWSVGNIPIPTNHKTESTKQGMKEDLATDPPCHSRAVRQSPQASS